MKVEKGMRFESNFCGWFEVVEYRGTFDVLVKNLTSGKIKSTTKKSILEGEVRCYYYPRFWGVGYFGEGKYIQREKFNVYMTWKLMLRRCYDTKYTHYRDYGDRGVKVCDEWHNYQNFASWAVKNKTQAYLEIDKDLKFKGNKMYHPDYCSFVPREINLLISYPKIKSKWGEGVVEKVYKKGAIRYIARVSYGDKRKYIGQYETPEEASKAYYLDKQKRVREVAEHYYSKGLIEREVYLSLYHWYANEIA